MSRILFLDFDGVMIPTRAYWLEGQTRPVTKFDPCAVSLLNKVCEENDLKIVLVTSWRRTVLGQIPEDLKKHCINNGIKEEFIHEDYQCPWKFTSSKYNDVNFWLENHPEVKDYIIVDDDLDDEYGHKGKIIVPVFDEGLNYDIYLKVSRHFDNKARLVF